MDNSRITGAKQSVQNMLFYYISALIDSGVKDVKQYIASEIGDMIDLSEEQVSYVQSHISNENKVVENLSSSIALLEGMEKTGKLDLEAIKIVKGILGIMKTQYQETMATFDIEDGDDTWE